MSMQFWKTGLIAVTFLIFGIVNFVGPAAAASGDGAVSGFFNWFSNDVLQGKGVSVSIDDFGRTTASWSDGHNKLKVKIEGKVVFGDDDRSIRSISRSGSFSIWEKRGSQTTGLFVDSDRNGELRYEYEVDGKETLFDDAGRSWLGRVLIEVMRKTGVGAEDRANRILDRAGVNGLLDEVQFVEGDYVLRIYLSEALKRPTLSTADCAAILSEAAMSMESDYEKAELLLTVAKHQRWGPELAPDFVDVAATMKSDYEIRRALSKIKIDESIDQVTIDAILQIAAQMESDYETAELLIALAPRCQDSDQLTDMYVRAVAGIESDYEARRALHELDWRGGMSSGAVVGALNVAQRLESDYDAAELLTELAPYSADDPAAVSAYMNAVSGINSGYDASRVLVAFAENDDLDEATVLAMLRTAGQISSSYDQSNALRAALRHCVGNQDLEDAFLDAVDGVDSDYERDQLYSSFGRKTREASRARRGE